MPDLSLPLHTQLAWALVSATAIPIIWILALYCRRIATVVSTIRSQTARDAAAAKEPSPIKEWPGVSVIVYSAGESTALQSMLPSVLLQDYPGPMEVIVVNDGRNEAVKDVVTLLRNYHNNLYVTFTPEESRNLSRKKLSLTLGIKAARYDYVVLTEERAKLPGNQWLRLMAQPMVEDPSTEMVIGYSAPSYDNDEAIGSRYRSFDLAAEGIAYLSSAINGHPWRGTSFNLAYRKSLFFANKGFGHSLNLQTGDDDIFVSEVATADNCVVELSPNSQVTVAVDSPRTFHSQEREARAFSAHRIPQRPSAFFAISSIMMWLWIALAIAAIAFDWQNWQILVAVGVSACILWIPVIALWYMALHRLQAHKALLTIPEMLLRRPFTNLHYRQYARRHRSQNYTWRSKS
jgi:hypothetical protein